MHPNIILRGKMKVQSFYFLLLICKFNNFVTCATFKYKEPFKYRCLAKENIFNSKTTINNQIEIGLQVNKRITSQLLSRIFAIFLQDVMDVQNVSLVPFIYNGNNDGLHHETDKFRTYLERIRINPRHRSIRMMDLDVWLPPSRFFNIPPTILEAGPSLPPGRFGWFIPKSTLKRATDDILFHYSIFQSIDNKIYRNFTFDTEICAKLYKNNSNFFENAICKGLHCVTLVAEYKEDTAFVINQIKEMNLFLNVIWLGDNFRSDIDWLYKKYEKKPYNSFIILHWRLSDIIYNANDFFQIELPNCECWDSLKMSNCKYEMTSIVKFYADSLKLFKSLEYAVLSFKISDRSAQELFKEFSLKYNEKKDYNNLLNDIACNWLKQNKNLYTEWIFKEKLKLSIGGIFPQTSTTGILHNAFAAVNAAVKAVNNNNSILSNFEVQLFNHEDRCKADLVMKTIIHYFNVPMMLGVLGPACSDTIEPVAGISKHMRIPIISYSAEGSSLENRQEYPYFFRTIGSNRQYKDVYVALMKKLGWHRIGTITEDGKKYAEYISHMEIEFKHHQLELALNKKITFDANSDTVEKVVADFKEKHIRIIIADVPNNLAEKILCTAYKFKMTAKHGFVWFLPFWIVNNVTIDRQYNHSCSKSEIIEAVDGHFSIFHTPFGEPDTIMQEGICVQKWQSNFFSNSTVLSNHVGFAYDAVWVYALAADKLFKKNPSAVHNLREYESLNLFTNIIWQTEFSGVSGLVKFDSSGSRITDVDIKQWNNCQYIQIGKFKPEIKNGILNSIYTKKGTLEIEENKIVWLTGSNPGDGKFDCQFSLIAKLINEDCNSATFVATCLICTAVIIFVYIISFWFWKQRFNKKIKESAKIMKTFGIDIVSPAKSSINTLDKWEIPKKNVVLNRTLGEGAFGTVYGGEAKIDCKTWTAVAVKTLKINASSEDRLDFLSEAEAMKRFHHKNIVKLLGVCLQSDPIYTIMEFMLYGDLKTYLLARRHLVAEQLHDDSDVSPKRLTMYAIDIARGIDYLCQQKYVHRDIACRNCLVNAERVVKLGDFGMSRPINSSDYYRFNRKGMLPVRWMAPEALALGYFTSATDIWAYGVVLYEIITFGSFPFQGLTNKQVVEYVKAGNTLQVPPELKPQLKGLIKACWSSDAKKRPTAREIIDYISSYPRIITPFLDFPTSSLILPNNQTREVHLLFENYGLSSTPQNPNSNLNTFSDETVKNMSSCTNLFSKFDHDKNDQSNNLFCSTTPDGYSIMTPLLQNQAKHFLNTSEVTKQQNDF